jgi:hypothetical protein
MDVLYLKELKVFYRIKIKQVLSMLDVGEPIAEWQYLTGFIVHSIMY